jgi:hypothetical protein
VLRAGRPPHDAAQCHAALSAVCKANSKSTAYSPTGRTTRQPRALASMPTRQSSARQSQSLHRKTMVDERPRRRLFVGILPLGQACFGGDVCVPG